MSGKITRSVVSGAAWSGISQIVSQGLRFVSIIFLARILTPEDFGLIAMVSIITTIAGNLIDFGFIEVLIQRKEITRQHLVTSFWVILMTGTLLCILVVSLSHLISLFFNDSRVGPLLSVTSIIFIIQSSAAVHSALLRRKLLFFQAALADMADAFGYILGALSAAYAGLGVWSLVIGNICGNTPGVILRWILSGWRPGFSFHLSSFQDLWKFGLNILGTRLVYITLDKLDYLVLGKFLLPAALGFYSQAFRIARIPSDSLGAIGNRVILPALSLVQDENQRLQQALLRGESFLSIIGLPLFFGMAVVAPELVLVLIGSQWIPSILPLRVLCISGAIAVLNIGVPAVFLAKGKPGVNLKLSLLQMGLLIPSLLFAVRYGILGVSITVSAISLIVWLVRQIFVHQVINLSFKNYLLSLRPALIASLIMTIGLLILRYLLNQFFNPSVLVLLVLDLFWGAALYIASLKIGRSRAFAEIISLLSEMLHPLWKSAGLHNPNQDHKTARSKPYRES